MVCKNMKNYLNRKATIFKSAEQLSKLCDVPVLLLLYGPDMPNKPQVWCSEPDCGSVIDKYYGKKRKREVIKPGNSKVRKVGDDQFLGKLSLEELKDLNGILAGKIECVKERIDGFKGGKLSGNSSESRDFEGGLTLSELGDYGTCNKLTDCGKVSGNSFESRDFEGGLTLSELGDYGTCNKLNDMNVDSSFNDLGDYCFDEVKFEEVFNPMQAVYPSINTDYNIDYNDGFNIDDLGCEFGFTNPLCTSSPDDFEDNDLMIDISNLDDMKFVGDDLESINGLLTADDCAFVSELLDCNYC